MSSHDQKSPAVLMLSGKSGKATRISSRQPEVRGLSLSHIFFSKRIRTAIRYVGYEHVHRKEHLTHYVHPRLIKFLDFLDDFCDRFVIISY